VAETTRDRVRQMTEQGLTPRQIAVLLNLSTQAVYKHLANIKQDAEKSA
jgi:DNA-binding CsgD family transcriptional regulator